MLIAVGFLGVVSAEVTSIDLIKPDGGEFWSGTQNIEWTTIGCVTGTDFLNIQRSTGAGFTTFATVSCSPGIFNWNTATVSDSANYQIRIFLDSDFLVNGISNTVFTIDNENPTVDAEVDKTTTLEFTQTGAVSDNFNINSIAWTKISGPESGTVTFGSPNSAVTTISANTDGEYVLRLTATDESGNSAFDEMILSWDTTSPAIDSFTLNAGASDVFFNPGTVDIVITATEPVKFNRIKILNSGPSEVDFFTQTGTFETTATITWDGTGETGDGVYTLQVDIEDAAGNIVDDLALTPYTITVDKQDPTVSALSNPVVDTVYKTSIAIPLTFIPTDPSPGTLLTCGYKVGAEEDFVSLGSCTSGEVFENVINEADLIDGRNDILGIVVDSAGNTEETSSVTIVFDNDNTLSVPSDFTTIQGAIDATTSGDTINVAAGTYNELITINKPLTLQGAGVENTIIDMSSLGTASVREKVILVDIVSGDVTIDGFEIILGDNMDGIDSSSGDSSSTLTISNNKNGVRA